jgi:hypothetical protein
MGRALIKGERSKLSQAMGRILKVDAPFLLGIIDVIAIPRLTRFFGARLLHFGACATAKARHDEEGEKAGNFQAVEKCVFHFFLVCPKIAQVPQLF